MEFSLICSRKQVRKKIGCESAYCSTPHVSCMCPPAQKQNREESWKYEEATQTRRQRSAANAQTTLEFPDAYAALQTLGPRPVMSVMKQPSHLR